MKNIGKLLITFGATFAAAAVGSLATFKEIPTWYETLNRTVISPPNWVFGPVWTILYILMATAAFLVWKNRSQVVSSTLILFGGQLGLNALWSILFFGQHLILTAFVEILFLLALIIWTTILFFKIKKLAGYLMLPYIAWVSFAAVLNFLTWLANR